VRVLPSTRTLTVAAEATAGTARQRTIRTTRRLLAAATNPPSARGSSLAATGRASDSGLPLHRLPGAPTQWRSRRRASPLTAAGPPPAPPPVPPPSPPLRPPPLSPLSPLAPPPL